MAHSNQIKQKTKKQTKTITLPLSFYQSTDVVTIAKELLGKRLCTQIGDAPITSGIIIETEAYAGIHDRACHAFGNKRTKRTDTMYKEGGISYIYFCYGMHHLLNVVTNKEGTPHAVLIRSIHPTTGIEVMLRRRKQEKSTKTLTSGPGCVCQALGLTLENNGLSLDKSPLWIENTGITFSKNEISSGHRIGVAYAKEDALLPWRFYIKEFSAKIEGKM